MVLAPKTAVTVPLVRINIRDDKGTNRPRFAPIYEAPLLKLLWEGQATIEVQEHSAIGPGGQPWPKDMTEKRTSMARELRRLSEQYKQHPTTKAPLFTQIYGLGQFPEAFIRAVSGRWRPTDKAPEPRDDDASLMEEHIELTAEEMRLLGNTMGVGEMVSEETVAAEAAAAAEGETGSPVDEDIGEAAPVGAAGEEVRRGRAAQHPAMAVKPEAKPSGKPAGKPAPAAKTAGPDPIKELSRVKGVSAEMAAGIVKSLGVSSVAELANVPADELVQVPGIGPMTAKAIAESAQDLALANT